ncbi:MAG: NAD(P)(+) transhydrogenase (Re/Si-specific) subunit beta [Firmicutes bacterium]|nr:NAD(P)(+) transhydrogenase (Re/Si-specific) subunit beta [Bacillota bacterium]
MEPIYIIISIVLAALVLLGIKLMSSPKTAVQGNLISAFSMLAAVILVLWTNNILSLPLLWAAIAIGSIIGYVLGMKVTMIQMPQVVALLNGLGGGASLLVAAAEILSNFNQMDAFSKVSGQLALIVGGITLSGSMIAAAKLDRRMSQRPVVLKGHNILANGSLVIMIVATFLTLLDNSPYIFLSFLILILSLAYGYLFSVRVGGADMPITISLLNSFSGLAGAIVGFTIGEPLLVAVGAIVGASGLILTQIMCKAMNRSLGSVLSGGTSKPSSKPKVVPAKVEEPVLTEPIKEEVAKSLGDLLKEAQRVIIIPGYGMALAQAQNEVKALTDALIAQGKQVEFAIHPVAGRMPGHMNVLLAEVDVPYELMREMDDINPLFAETDVAIVVGSCDVVNPAANTAEDTPIYGMPVLSVENAKHVIVCNLDTNPGYSGVDNPLYEMEHVRLLLGDAKATLKQLLAEFKEEKKSEPQEIEEEKTPSSPSYLELLHQGEKVIFVPGYGMALAQAQSLVKQLADALEEKGKEVKFAIHPVAGRMPGHMNVLLAETDVPYDKLWEMDDINPLFPETDIVIIVGANDVVNPAANTAEDTPIYGMPVLSVENAKHVIVCNLDKSPGYSGVDNPLYEMDNVTLLLGDAKESLTQLIDQFKQGPIAKEPEPLAQGTDTLTTVLAKPERVIIVPGYGMALAQAQTQVKEIYETLEAKGTEVEFAIHPVAGRMPGHMNVLLAEVDIPYEKLREMDDINPLFPETDLVIIVGANDVVNPAANTAEDTPIYGMPILNVDQAKHIVVCNLDQSPGYSGVDNPLYEMDNVTLLLGDAKDSLNKILDIFKAEPSAAPEAEPTSVAQTSVLAAAKKVIIVPGYGMALAQAQTLVKSVYDALEAKGAEVEFAIHPVAGRMHGHMNVLLAEVDVPYEKLREMDDINPLFPETDVVIVVGANDVVNPAANTAEDTPIYGMPILNVDQAKHIIVCNLDRSPGYSGVDNPLYDMENVTLLLGDAKASLEILLEELK